MAKELSTEGLFNKAKRIKTAINKQMLILDEAKKELDKLADDLRQVLEKLQAS